MTYRDVSFRDDPKITASVRYSNDEMEKFDTSDVSSEKLFRRLNVIIVRFGRLQYAWINMLLSVR